ncbi:hypothetical protein [Cupriavidus basilensis]|uniref:hypothetical protein n=1 Tax=Cupriavidus basilensis TaxID=68895 RepID=UPI0007C87AE7|nr:hypothetical protein [Cupriavidus basilensis]
MKGAFELFCIVSIASLSLFAPECHAQETVGRAAKPATPQTMRGVDLLSSEEKADFCARMRAAATPEERREITRRLHDLVHTRADQHGVVLRHERGGGQRMYGGGRSTASLDCGPMMGRSADTDQPAAGGLPPQKRASGVAYLSGGIGEDEAAAFRAAAPAYSLRLTFTGKRGEFLADVDTRIYKPDGKQIFRAISDGPFMYIKLPAGKYRVVATANGIERKTEVTIPSKGGVAQHLNWPS